MRMLRYKGLFEQFHWERNDFSRNKTCNPLLYKDHVTRLSSLLSMLWLMESLLGKIRDKLKPQDIAKAVQVALKAVQQEVPATFDFLPPALLKDHNFPMWFEARIPVLYMLCFGMSLFLFLSCRVHAACPGFGPVVCQRGGARGTADNVFLCVASLLSCQQYGRSPLACNVFRDNFTWHFKDTWPESH